MNADAKARARVKREGDAFERTWARYVSALERSEAPKETLGGHWRRVRRGARREALRLHEMLSTRFKMHWTRAR